MREIVDGGRVECYSGSAYAEHPTAFYWQGEYVQVKDIIRRWREPGVMCFHVRTTTDQLFDLAYDERGDFWLISQP
ncbi:MAG TPA: hypothetical protein VLA49_07860 [Anaerolineales bacterium]|nr:hypothetical protein [Anaerolineales bacterium]